MAEYKVPDAYNTYLSQLQDKLLSSTQTVEYNPLSASALKSSLAKMLRPEYDRAIANRQKTAAKNRAAIDTDAAARGMGSSSWVTDVKNRQNDAAETDIAGLEDDYISSLYGNLLSKLGEQESRKLSVDQFNASAKQNALSQALSTANQYYPTWLKGQQAKQGSGRGGNPNPGAGEPDPAAAKLQALIAQYNAAGMVNNAPQTNNAQQKLPGTIRRAKGRIQNTKVYMQ